jgi:hypothetical protein
VQDLAALVVSKLPVAEASVILAHLTGVPIPPATLVAVRLHAFGGEVGVARDGLGTCQNPLGGLPGLFLALGIGLLALAIRFLPLLANAIPIGLGQLADTVAPRFLEAALPAAESVRSR